MKYLIIILMVLGCVGRAKVMKSGESWVCNAPQGYFEFHGEEAQNLAHARCDKFLPMLDRKSWKVEK